MRFGITLGTLLNANDIIKCAKVADDYSDLILIPESWGRDAFVTLGLLSSITNKAYIGSGIISIYSRTAASIAMGASTLDIYSNKRVIIGLGASSKTLVNNWHGLEFKDNITRMREYVECIRLILTGEKVNYEGKIVKVRNFRLGFKPLRSDIPIYIAAVRDRMLRLAKEIGDGLILFLYPKNEVRNVLIDINRDKFKVLYVIMTCIADDKDKAIERIKKSIAFYIAVGDIYAKFLAEHGFNEEVESVKEEYNKHGFANIHEYVSQRMLDSLAIYGNEEECNKRFKEFTSLNVIPILHFNPVNDAENSLRRLLEVITNE